MFFLLVCMTHGQPIEIFESGQISSSSKSIGTVLYINLFNCPSTAIRISGVVERYCLSVDYCMPVRLMGGDFGVLKSRENRSVIFSGLLRNGSTQMIIIFVKYLYC